MNSNQAATRPLRCTIIAPYANLGGAEYWLLRLLEERQRLDPTVVLLTDGPLRQALAALNVPVEVMTTGRSARSILESTFGMVGRLRRSDADVVLANGVKAALVGIPAARAIGVPVVWAKHDFSLDRRLGRLLGSLADRVVANSEAVGEITKRDDLVLIPPPRPEMPIPDRTTAFSYWNNRGLELGDIPALAMIGRLVPYKGIDTAIEALADPRAKSWRLVVVGPDDPAAPNERRRLEELSVSLGVNDRVVIMGEVANAGRWLAAFDAVAVLTRKDGDGYGREGYSIVALEAVASGVPLIAADVNPEAARLAARTGGSVPVNDTEAVVEALGKLADHTPREELAAATRRLTEDHPDAATCNQLFIEVLAETAGRPGAGLAGPPVTVLTCMKNEAGHVDGVMERVVRQLAADDEYLVVDDGSEDSTASEIAVWAEQDSRIRVQQGPAVNAAAARNAGISGARHGVVVCTDAGCVPSEDWLASLRAPFAEPHPPDLVAGVYSVPGGGVLKDAFSICAFPRTSEARRRTPFIRVFARLFGRGFSRDRLDTRSMAVSVAAWRLLGGFDEALFSSEDADFGHRAASAGLHRVLALDAEVAWEQADTLRQMVAMYRRYGEGGVRARDWNLVSRDVIRAGAYVAAAHFWRGDAGGKLGVLLGSAAYLSLPVARGLRDRSSPVVLAAIPFALAVKDFAKMLGCVDGLLIMMSEDRGPQPFHLTE